MMRAAARLNDRIPAGLWLVLLALLVYLPSYGGPFFWDDQTLIVANKQLATPGGIFDIWFKPGALAEYYPLTHTTYWLEARFGLLQPVPMRVVNVLLLGVTAWLLYRLAARLQWKAPWFGAALVVLHPVHVESVAWISQRKTVLSGLFVVLAVGAWVAYRESGTRKTYVAALAWFVAALLAKTQAIVVLPGFLLLDWYRFGRIDRAAWRASVPFFAIGGFLALVTRSMEQRFQPSASLAAKSFVDKIGDTGSAPWHYAGKLLAPVNCTLVYPWPSVGLLGLLWVVVVALLYIFRARLGRGPFAVGAYFVVALAPVLGLIYFPYMSFSLVADRFQYYADLAALPAIAALGAILMARVPAVARVGVASLAALVLGALSLNQAGIYSDEANLWQTIAERNPKAWVALESMGNLAAEQGHQAEAMEAYRKAFAISSDSVASGIAIAESLSAEKKDQEALAIYAQLEKEQAQEPAVFASLGIFHLEREQYAQAAAAFEKGLAVDPNLRSIVMNYATMLVTAKDRSQRNPKLAVEIAQRLDRSGAEPIDLYCLASVYRDAGDAAKARETFERALSLAEEKQDFETEGRIREALNALK